MHLITEAKPGPLKGKKCAGARPVLGPLYITTD